MAADDFATGNQRISISALSHGRDGWLDVQLI
jgi:hypothetical protein